MVEKKKVFLKALLCVFCGDSWESPETRLVILSLPNSHRQTHDDGLSEVAFTHCGPAALDTQ